MRVAAQIYIVQRQAVTMWDDPTRTFVLQQLNKGIYDHFTTVPSIPVQERMELLASVIDFNSSMLQTIDSGTLNRWVELSAKWNPSIAEAEELAALEADINIINYKIYTADKTAALAELDAIPISERPSSDIKYVTLDNVNYVDYNTLTDLQKKSLVSDRVYVRTQYDGEVGYSTPMSLRLNRNEVEIMASCDMYSSLETNFGQCNPSKQTRMGRLEYEIEKLISLYYSGEGFGKKDISEFILEARIV